MSKLLATVKAAVPLVVVGAVVAGCVVLALSVFAGGDGDGDGGTALALGPPESSWLPGQASLAQNPDFAVLAGRALPLAQERSRERERALEELERRKVEAKKRADAAARRAYERAKRRAERLYQLALKRAAEERKRQLERIAAAKRRAERLRREREEKLKVEPGPECDLPGVRETYDCRTGRLPDTAPPPKRRGNGN